MQNWRCCMEEMAGFHDSGFLIVLYFCDNMSNDENWRSKNSWSMFLNLTQIDGIHTEWYLMLNKINKILQFHSSIQEVNKDIIQHTHIFILTCRNNVWDHRTKPTCVPAIMVWLSGWAAQQSTLWDKGTNLFSAGWFSSETLASSLKCGGKRE